MQEMDTAKRGESCWRCLELHVSADKIIAGHVLFLFSPHSKTAIPANCNIDDIKLIPPLFYCKAVMQLRSDISQLLLTKLSAGIISAATEGGGGWSSLLGPLTGAK